MSTVLSKWRSNITLKSSNYLCLRCRRNSTTSQESFLHLKKPLHYWKDVKNQRDFFDKIGKYLKIKNFEDWYNISIEDIAEYGGKGFMKEIYSNSVIKALVSIYPEYNWDVWRFGKISTTIWKDTKVQKAFLDSLFKQLQMNTFDEWYHVKQHDVKEHGGAGLLLFYGNSIKRMLMSVYPSYPWKVWKFEHVPQGHWTKKEHQVYSLKYLNFQRELFDYIGQRLGVKRWEDWYKVKKSDVIDYGGDVVLKSFYGNSLKSALVDLYPEHPFSVWKFSQLPKQYFETLENQRSFLRDIGNVLQIKHWTDWYKYSSTDIEEIGGKSMIQEYYEDSLSLAVLNLFPEYPWKVWKFKVVPRKVLGYWSNLDHHRAFFDDISRDLGINKMEDWYKVKRAQVEQRGGSGILLYHNNSLFDAFLAVYPEHNWNHWSFSKVSKLWWKEPQNQKFYCKFLFNVLGYKDWTDWYKVTQKDFEENDGSGNWRSSLISKSLGLLALYDGSPSKVISSVFPQYDFKIWKFQTVPSGFWADPKNHRLFLDDFWKVYNLKNFEDWYEVKKRDIDEHGGGSMIHYYYGDSLAGALVKNYPEYSWKVWRFHQVPKGFWNNESNIKSAVAEIQKELNIRSPGDWKKITKPQLDHLNLYKLAARFGGLKHLLEKVFPDEIWDFIEYELQPGFSKTQMQLFHCTKEFFPDQEIHIDYAHPELFTKNGKNVQLDVYFPSLKLALEYQGTQHYSQHFLFGSSDSLQSRDEEKRNLCKKANITLIEIPFWWDCTKESLAATINKYRSDLIPDVPEDAVPISEVPPKTGKLYSAKIQLSNATVWDRDQDPKGWWISEFIEGIRVFWNGADKLILKTGEVIPCPQNFLENLPQDLPLDGILKAKNRTFEELSKMIKELDEESKWEDIVFHAIDAPTQTFVKYEQRMKEIEDSVDSTNKNFHFQKSIVCEGKEHLQREMEDIKSRGGIGVIFRKPNTLYFQDSSYYKLLNYREEKALVLGYNNGYLECKTLDEIKVNIPSKDSIPPNTVLSFRYLETLEDGTPISPQVLHPRPEISWEFLLDQRKNSEYTLAIGNNFGSTPKCKGCGKRFSDRNEVRIIVHGVFTPPNAAPYMNKVNMCLNMICLEKALRKSERFVFPKFTGIVKVPFQLRDSINFENLAVEGITWVYETSK